MEKLLLPLLRWCCIIGGVDTTSIYRDKPVYKVITPEGFGR